MRFLLCGDIDIPSDLKRAILELNQVIFFEGEGRIG